MSMLYFINKRTVGYEIDIRMKNEKFIQFHSHGRKEHV